MIGKNVSSYREPRETESSNELERAREEFWKGNNQGPRKSPVLNKIGCCLEYAFGALVIFGIWLWVRSTGQVDKLTTELQQSTDRTKGLEESKKILRENLRTQKDTEQEDTGNSPKHW